MNGSDSEADNSKSGEARQCWLALACASIANAIADLSKRKRDVAAEDANSVADTLACAKARYLDSLARRPSETLPTAEDILALTALASGDKGRGIKGALRVVIAIAIVLATLVILAIGLQTAPTTRIDMHTETDYVSVTSSKTADTEQFEVSSAVSVESLDFSGAGMMEAVLSQNPNGAGAGLRCAPLQMSGRTVTLLRPEGVRLTYAAESTLALSALKSVGSNRFDQLRIDGGGPWTLIATLPRSEKASGDCDQFKKDTWSVPANLTFLPPAKPVDAAGEAMVFQVLNTGKEAPHATALVSPLLVVASLVSFDAAATGSPQWLSAPFRCAIRNGGIDFVQRIPLIGIEFAGHEDLRPRQCPSLNPKGMPVWKVRIGATDGGLFEVVQSANDDDGLGRLYLDGAMRGREIGKSYLDIVKNDAGLALVVSVATLILTNLWSFAQLLKRWLS